MSKIRNPYASIAIRAAKLGCSISPIEAWEAVAKEVFPNQYASQSKSCPKSAYLGLCEEGLVNNIPKGKYTRSKVNKDYALKGYNLLLKDSTLSESEMWKLISKKNHNNQMHVVRALFEEGFLS